MSDQETDDPDGWQFEMQIVDPIHKVLAESARPDDEWLWCIYCERFFQARHLRIDYQGNRQGCAFCECAGFNVAIHRWNTFAEDDPDWPGSEAELRHGLRLGSES